MKTYDIYFNDSSDSNNKGFAQRWIIAWTTSIPITVLTKVPLPITKAAQCLLYAMRQARLCMKLA